MTINFSYHDTDGARNIEDHRLGAFINEASS